VEQRRAFLLVAGERIGREFTCPFIAELLNGVAEWSLADVFGDRIYGRD
jgi:hypothetical protein